MLRRRFWVLSSTLAGCTAPGLDHVGSGGDLPAATASTSSNTAATSAEDASTDSGAPTTTEDSSPNPGQPSGSGGDTDDALAVLDVVFTPNPLEYVGTIAVTVAATPAAGVRMELPGQPPIDLSPGPDDNFVGEFEVLSGLANGTHEALFTAWQGELHSAPFPASYTVALPKAGEPVQWDTSMLAGPGEIEALDFLPDHHVVALGSRQPTRCYLHRLDLAGQYGVDDIVDVHPDQDCIPTDLRVGPEGSIYFLANVNGGNGWRWRLAVTHWGEPPVVLRTGAKDEVAHALTLDPNGEIVVCGAGPSGMGDIDARVWNVQGTLHSFDYRPTDDENQNFDETIRACAHAGDRLVMTGDVRGLHEEDPLMPKRRRMFVLEQDPEQIEPIWTVPGIGPGSITQSSATALALDGAGRYIVGLYVCEDACTPAGELRIYEPGGALTEWMPLPSNVMSPNDLAWSPAGYVVLASAQIVQDPVTRFFLSAYVPGTYEPAWTYKKAEMATTHIANAVVVAPGVVVGAGVGGKGLPAFAFLHP